MHPPCWGACGHTAGRHDIEEFSTNCKTNSGSTIVVEMGTASFTEDPIWWVGGGASGEGAAAVVSCLDGAVSAGEGGDGNGAGEEAGEGKGGSDGKGNIESIVVSAGGISCVFCVIHSSVGVLGVVLLLVGVEGVRSQRVEALPPSSWGIVLFGNHG
jgi:hypothetical protein